MQDMALADMAIMYVGGILALIAVLTFLVFATWGFLIAERCPQCGSTRLRVFSNTTTWRRCQKCYLIWDAHKESNRGWRII